LWIALISIFHHVIQQRYAVLIAGQYGKK